MAINENEGIYLMCNESYFEIHKNGTKCYYKNGTEPDEEIYHRTDGPAIEWANGNKEWYINGKWHREGGPAIEWVNGYKEWYINGKWHRIDGPAIEYSNGDKYWYINGELHRESGPAIEYSNGDKYWYINGELHREDGPAIELYDGVKHYSNEWFLNDKRYSEEEYWRLIKLKVFI